MTTLQDSSLFQETSFLMHCSYPLLESKRYCFHRKGMPATSSPFPPHISLEARLDTAASHEVFHIPCFRLGNHPVCPIPCLYPLAISDSYRQIPHQKRALYLRFHPVRT